MEKICKLVYNWAEIQCYDELVLALDTMMKVRKQGTSSKDFMEKSQAAVRNYHQNVESNRQFIPSSALSMFLIRKVALTNLAATLSADAQKLNYQHRAISNGLELVIDDLMIQ